jgi:hypothetical protein
VFGDPIPSGYGKCPFCCLCAIPQRRVEARLAHTTSLAAVTLRKSVSTGRAPELDPSCRVTLSVGMERGSFRPASHALLAEDLLALHTHTGHDRPQMCRKN